MSKAASEKLKAEEEARKSAAKAVAKAKTPSSKSVKRLFKALECDHVLDELATTSVEDYLAMSSATLHDKPIYVAKASYTLDK